MANVALSALRARAREAADMVGSSFVTDTADSLDAFINAGAQELYKLLVAKFEDYFDVATSPNIVLVAGTSKYGLPADFFKLRGVEVQVGSAFRSLSPGRISQRNQGQGAGLPGLQFMRYRLEGQSLIFMPAPNVAGVARALYIAQFSPYALDTDGREWWGWDEYIVQVAAAKCAVKEESDPSPFLTEARRLAGQIVEEASNRDASEPASVGDADDALVEDYPWLLP